VEVNRVFR